MQDRLFITVTAQFEGIHRWKDAPASVAYLRDYHRHEFYVTATIQVFHDDRELEFITVKNELMQHLSKLYVNQITGSCEMIASDIINHLSVKYGSDRLYEVSVFEDGENGATVIRDRRD